MIQNISHINVVNICLTSVHYDKMELRYNVIMRQYNSDTKYAANYYSLHQHKKG